MPNWTLSLIFGAFGALAVYVILNEIVQRRRVRRDWANADARTRARCDIITGPDGTEYATLKPEYRPTTDKDATRG